MRIYIKNISYLVVFTSVFLGQIAFASAVSELNALLSNIKSMRANFTQTIYDNQKQPVQKSYGSMALERPGKFRWQVVNPIPQTIIANHAKIWVYDPDLEQITIRALNGNGNDAPALLLSHDNQKLEKGYTVVKEGNTKGLVWFKLTPKHEDNAFSLVKMGFKQNEIIEMILDDQIGHSTKVTFNKVKTNINIPKKLFVLKAPKGTDVIDETH